ncbi:D-ribose pyranase [Paenarthrobacter sp. Z7-10]|uniref:D-ribose pyranase n=1 Tax=Paenarthrobacter sp. Z7-10 TaxID=2787635 RepID=UPI0022A8DE8C|nr:D-ribose pyranase [Paenarthrobacter sp. Z7-10]MCZ2403650.1 D-ribose pyranase [Paenarthrobacter sp. Z7-10]
MKKTGILNAELNFALSKLGHTDLILVADCGLPAPAGVTVVDLALVRGIPRLEQVLDALLADIVVERCVAAEEVKSTLAQPWLTRRFAQLDYISHDSLKDLSASAKLFIRTGEATAYANAALYCGVAF